MNFNKTPKIIAISLAAAAALITASAGYSSYLVNSKLLALKSATGNADFHLDQLDHKAGLFSSTGVASVSFSSRCSADISVPAKVEYTIHHLPLPWSPIRAEFKIKPADNDVVKSMNELAGGNFSLDGVANMSWLWKTSANVSVPRLHKEGLDIPQNAINVDYDATNSRFSWLLPTISYRSESDVFQLENAKLEANLVNGTPKGDVQFSVGKIATGKEEADGLALNVHSASSNGKIDIVYGLSIQKAAGQGQNFKDLALEFHVGGLDEKSVTELSELLTNTCSLNKATISEKNQVRADVQKIFASGWSLGVSKLSGANEKGAVNANFNIALLPAKPDAKQIIFKDYLSASGKLELSGEVVPEQAVLPMIESGVFVRQGTKLTASVEYKNNNVALNGTPGKPENMAELVSSINMAEMLLNSYLSGKSEQADAAPVAPTPQ